MAELPVSFTESTRLLMGPDRFERFLHSFDEQSPVSIRLNPLKAADMAVIVGEPVPWCRNGYYLPCRPNFTMDPLLHAGCYYVQEAASMFLDEVLRQHLTAFVLVHTALDMCAAPGGKSTLLRSALPPDSVLYSNEPVRLRAAILSENVAKWGYGNHYVTNAYPRDYRKSKMQFDLIVCDVPCSGEGMFRKDPATIREWSPQQVEKCWQLQRDIVCDAWACLKAGGLLIYSTCTFNTKENEENIRWMLDEFGDAEVLPVDVRPDWHITGSLLDGFHEPVYRFIPGISRSEGLFVCVVHKQGQPPVRERVRSSGDYWSKHPELRVISPLPAPQVTLPRVELDYPSAMAYLRHEALQLSPDTPRGIVEVCFLGHVLGQAKNIGTRANNLYPKEWKIKTTHIPNEYEPILRPL